MRTLPLALVFFFAAANAARPTESLALSSDKELHYIWKTTPVGNTAELVTLFCRNCDDVSDVPLVSLMHDTLGGDDPHAAHITDVWLLSYRKPGVGRRMLSAVPFFYWRVGTGSPKATASLSPLLDMNSLQHPAASAMTQNILQWTLFDPISTPVRASTRAFRGNAADEERLHVEEAIGYLQQAPESSAITPEELRTVVARLELRKTLLGGFVNARGAAEYGETASIRQREIEARNWELLRQWADKTGLYFESLSLAGSTNQYVVLWMARTGGRIVEQPSVQPIWKLLSLKPPAQSEIEHLTPSRIYERSLDENGELMPLGESSRIRVELVPLGIYSLDYPKLPLLMVDFRSQHHLRWRAMEQRSINEVTAGVIGISHFTNWYYYVAADLYDFVASRHGSPMNSDERLDCYSQFQARITLDHQLDKRLRAQIEQRINELAMNPLEMNPHGELSAANSNLQGLEKRAADGRLAKLVEKDRRRELATWNNTPVASLRQGFLHVLTLGVYTPEVKASDDIARQVSMMRRAQYQLAILKNLAQEGTPPEVSLEGSRIRSAVAELQSLIPQVKSDRFRIQARETIALIRKNSEDNDLRASCGRALEAIDKPDQVQTEVVLKPVAVHVNAFE